ncbi:MAG: archaellin/type IV pilin N-terminal domain-containing protein [archaeon]
MFYKNERAVSSLVATVLLILITVAAVGIIWGAIMPMLNSAMEIGQACLNARLTIDTTSGYTCYKTTTNEVMIMVGRGAEEFYLAGMSLIISGGGQSKTFQFKQGAAIGGVKMIDGTTTIQLPSTNEERTYLLFIGTNLTSVEEAKVAPIARVGKTDRACDVSSKVPLTICS